MIAERRNDLRLAPVLLAFAEAIERSPLAFHCDQTRAGLDLSIEGSVSGLKNRARVKLFEPAPHTALAWFYKDSQVPLSTDRFSYGARIWKGEAADPAEFETLLTWLESGLHPELRPAKVRRAFPFTIPD